MIADVGGIQVCLELLQDVIRGWLFVWHEEQVDDICGYSGEHLA